MPADFREKGAKKNQYQKKYLYTYSYEGEDEGEHNFLDDYTEFEAEFEQPRGRRSAKKSPVIQKKRKQSADMFY